MIKNWKLGVKLYLILVPIVSSTLLGRYKLWDSFGDAFYDYSNSENHAAMVIRDLSIEPIWTDRGIYLQEGNVIQFPNNAYKNGLPAFTEQYASFWVRPISPGVIFETTLIKSGINTTIRVYFDNNNNDLKVIIMENNSEIPNNVRNGSHNFGNIHLDIWMFITIHWGSYSNRGWEIALHYDSKNLSFASVSIADYEFAVTSTWSIKSETQRSFRGYFYEVWWHDIIEKNINFDLTPLMESSLKCMDTCNTSIYNVCMNSQTDPNKSCNGLGSCSCNSCYDNNLCIVNCSSLGCTNPNACFISNGLVCIENSNSKCSDNTVLNYTTGLCECKAGYSVYSNTPLKCVLSQPNCYSYDSSGCTECQIGYYLDSSTSPKTCTACTDPCIDCISAEVCTNCPSEYQLSTSGNISTCILFCPNGYYNNQDISCNPCIAKCISCSNSYDCQKCVDSYYLSSSSNQMSCVSACPLGYYEEYSEGRCESCNINNCAICEEISGKINCSLCVEGYILSNNECIQCLEGQFELMNKCEDCPENCKNCYSYSECIICTEGFEVDNGVCVTKEVRGFSFTASYQDGIIHIRFDKRLNSELGVKEFVIKVDDLKLEDDEFNLIPEGDLQNYKIELGFLLPHSILTLEMDNSITAQDGSHLLNTDYSITIQSSESSSDSNTISQSEYLASDSVAADANSIGATASRAAVSGAVIFGITVPSGIWSFINTLQLISLIPMMNIDIPIFLFGVLSGLRGYSPIPNILEHIIDKEGPQPYNRAVLMGYESSQFLLNCGDMITTLALTIILFPLLILIRKILSIKKRNSWIYRLVDRSILGYKWNVFTRFFVESYIEIGISAFMQIWVVGDESIYGSANLIINMILCIPILVISN